MASTSSRDPYVDPGTGVLRNLAGARTRAELHEVEGDLSFARLMQLLDHPPKPTGDLDELRAIHRVLFQDVYAWAGQLRTIDMRKIAAAGERPTEPFMPVSMIQRAADHAAAELRADNNLRAMGRDQFIERLAHHYDQVNYLHPFREGNGRTQRVFWSRVARDAGWQLDWRTVQGAVNDHASRTAIEERDLGPLRDMFDQVVTGEAPTQARRDTAWKKIERAHLAFHEPARQEPPAPEKSHRPSLRQRPGMGPEM